MRIISAREGIRASLASKRALRYTHSWRPVDENKRARVTPPRKYATGNSTRPLHYALLSNQHIVTKQQRVIVAYHSPVETFLRLRQVALQQSSSIEYNPATY
uniref:Uncharacterized protein n=1 Tax=Plectus sambesii TaxID=2011161 RepID=A0A914VVQ9_9BILA